LLGWAFWYLFPGKWHPVKCLLIYFPCSNKFVNVATENSTEQGWTGWDMTGQDLTSAVACCGQEIEIYICGMVDVAVAVSEF